MVNYGNIILTKERKVRKMFTKEELVIIKLSLMDRLQGYKEEFAETEELELTNDIDKMKELIEKVAVMYEE